MTQQRVSPISVTSVLPAVPVLSLQAALGQSANLTEWKNSSGTNLLSINSNGEFNFALSIRNAISWPLTIAQSAASNATFTNGNVVRWTLSPFGVTTLQADAAYTPLIAKGAASQTADLQQWQNSAGTVLARIDSIGRIRHDNASAANNTRTTFFTAVSGADATLGGLIAEFGNFPSATGASRYTYFGNGDNSAYRNFVFYPASTGTDGRVGINEVAPGAKLHITMPVASSIGLIVKGAASQTANLQEWQDSAGNILSRISSAGSIFAGAATRLSAVNGDLLAVANSAAVVPIVAKAAVSQTGNLQEWRNSSDAILTFVNSIGSIRIATTATGNAFAVSTSNAGAAAIGILVRGTTSQTANLQEWQDSAGTILAGVQANGQVFGTLKTNNAYVFIQEQNSGGSTVYTRQTATPAAPGANAANLYFRDGTNAGTLKLVVRAGTGGAETTILDNIPTT